MTPKPWTVPRDVTDLAADEPVKGGVLKRALGSLEVHLASVQAEAQEAHELADRAASKQSSDYRELQQVQAQIRATQDQDRATMLAAMGDLKADLVSMRQADDKSREEHGKMLAEAVRTLNTVQDWTVRHDGWHEGVKDGKRDTDETRTVAAKAGEEAGASALRRLPWDKIITALVTAALTALGISIGGCAHISPAERDDLEARDITAGTQCVAEPLLTCILGDGGWRDYFGCVWGKAAECAGEHIAAAAPAVLGMVLTNEAAMMAGVPGTAPYVMAVDRCVASLPEPLPGACRPDEALSACGGRWVAMCIDEGVSAARLGAGP